MLLVFCCQFLAFWPAVRWYVGRTVDASTGMWGLVALATAGYFVVRKRAAPLERVPRVGFCAIALLYALLLGRVPPLVTSIIAVLAMAWSISVLRLGRQMHPGFAGLLLLALPVVPTIQFFLGYPLRVLTAQGSVWMLSLFRIPVVREGTLLRWAGELVVIDAPCSGVHMLWTGMFLAATIACFHELRWVPAIGFAVWAGVLILLANVVRAGLLFLVETGLWPSFPGLHSGIGVAVFALMAGLLMGGFRLGCKEGARKRGRPVCCTHSSVGGEPRLAEASVKPPHSARRGSPPTHGSSPVLCLACGPVFIVLHLAVAGWGVFGGPAVSGVRGKVEPISVAEAEGWVGWVGEGELRAVPPTADDTRFCTGLPGATGRFTDGRTDYIVRRILRPTRSLHAAATCYRASGHRITPQPVWLDRDGNVWGRFHAEKDGLRVEVVERIADASGRGWYDVSSWYWAAALGRTSGPWHAVTAIRKLE